jgi:hypothetical protein
MTKFFGIKRSLVAIVALTATAGIHAAQSGSQPQQPAGASADKGDLMTTQVDHKKAMQNLLESAQKLRESIQAMAQQPAGDKRSSAMAAARDALVKTQQAMIDLPPEMRVESVEKVKATDWPKAAQRLQEASVRLDEAIQGMSKQKDGKGRSDAVAKARTALEQTQQAMLSLPDYSGPK